MGIQNTSVREKQKAEYLPRGRNTLHQVFERHFTDFCSRYEDEYADTFGKFRLERIQAVSEHFLTCGDYRQGIARPPVSLKKIHYEGFKGRVLFHTHYNEYFKENVHMFNACDFLAELTQHIPPKGVQLIRRYGLYSSRTKGAWQSMPIIYHSLLFPII